VSDIVDVWTNPRLRGDDGVGRPRTASLMAATTQMPNTHSIVIPAKAGIQPSLRMRTLGRMPWTAAFEAMTGGKRGYCHASAVTAAPIKNRPGDTGAVIFGLVAANYFCFAAGAFVEPVVVGGAPGASSGRFFISLAFHSAASFC